MQKVCLTREECKEFRSQRILRNDEVPLSNPISWTSMTWASVLRKDSSDIFQLIEE